jgi:tetratricopeptide (TPR) repeat protein
VTFRGRFQVKIAVLSLLAVAALGPAPSFSQTRIPKYLADVQKLEAQYKRLEAVAILDKVLRENPNNLVALWYRVRIYSELEQSDNLLNDCNRLIAADPKAERFPCIYTYRAIVYKIQDEISRAIKDLDKSKELGQIEYQYRLCRAECLQAQNKLKEAIGEWSEIVAQNPDRAHFALLRRSTLYEMLNQPEKALTDLSAASKLKPKQSDIRWSRARLLEQLHRYDDAIAEYTFLIQLDPTDETKYFKRGKLYASTGKYQLALADISKSISLDPMPSATIFQFRAQIYNKLGSSALAKKDLDAAAKIR